MTSLRFVGILVFLLLAFSVQLKADTVEPIRPKTLGVRVSILTCSAGEELYSTYGHSAVRVQDSARGTDKVYNYGT
ncbi:MAG: DUF4105 domain-containing protein, partial [Chitinophagaceae bacterium]|nr:DUF4105 domain-containing protein [Chitinophagaceae bacterium]